MCQFISQYFELQFLGKLVNIKLSRSFNLMFKINFMFKTQSWGNKYFLWDFYKVQLSYVKIIFITT